MPTIRGTILRDGRITSRRFPLGTTTTEIVEALAGEHVLVEHFPTTSNITYSFDSGRSVYKTRGHQYSANRDGPRDYRDINGQPIAEPDEELPCISCKKLPEKCLGAHTGPYGGVEMHEPCIGHRDNVRGLCCGHGIVEDAYLAYEDGDTFYGQPALDELENHNGTL